MRHASPDIANGQFFITLALLCMVPSEGLEVPSDRPDGKIPTNELADPVADESHGPAEHQRDVLGLSQEATQRAALDQAQVFRGLRPDIDNALDVGERQYMIHEMGGLQKGS